MFKYKSHSLLSVVAVAAALTLGGSGVAMAQTSCAVGETSVDSGIGSGSNHGLTPNARSQTIPDCGNARFAQSQPVGETSVDSGIGSGNNHGLNPNAGADRVQPPQPLSFASDRGNTPRFDPSQPINETSVDSGLGSGNNHGLNPNADTNTANGHDGSYADQDTGKGGVFYGFHH